MFLSVVRVLSIDCFLLLHMSQSRMRQNVLQLSIFEPALDVCDMNYTSAENVHSVEESRLSQI